MVSFTNSINNIINSGYLDSISSTKSASILSQALQTSAIDSVNFSQAAQNLLQISEIDTLFNGIFGLPNELTEDQQGTLESIRASLDTLFPNSSSTLSQINFEEIYANLGLDDTNKAQIQTLSDQLSTYLTELSIGQLFGTDSTANLSLYSNGYNTILGEQLNDEESIQLGTLSLQLNRLLYNNTDNDVSSYLNIFNDFYGLTDPNEDDLLTAASLLTQRNTLLSSVLLERSYQNTYTA